jgi:hypothetical protein
LRELARRLACTPSPGAAVYGLRGMPARRLSFSTRALAWVYTGPLGHLYGGLADWAALLGRLALARVRARVRGT